MGTDSIRKAGLALTLAGTCALAYGQTLAPVIESAKKDERRGTHVWIERPWTMRYVLAIVPAWPNAKKVAIKANARAKPGRSLSWEEVFEPVAAIPIPGESGSRANLSVVVIEFDEHGIVTTSNTHASPLRGRLNRIESVVLSAGEGATDSQYHLGFWFTGVGDASTHWAPGICALKEQPSPFSQTDTDYLYGPKFEINEFGPTFGCREWAYQLYDDERPYIDVTSYVRVGKIYPRHTYINDVIGWARFGDKKPVIGQHEGRWYCLHDCAGGQQPGAVPDIKAWATKNGWPAPKPPTKAPTFPDPPAKGGTYPR